MEKVMVEIYLPAAGETYDMRLPLTSRIGELLPLLETAMSEQAEGYYVSNQSAVLCDRQTGIILDVDLTVAETGIVNGTKLMLI